MGARIQEAQDLTDAFAQRPQLFIVEVGVSLNARARGESVCQKTILAVEGIPVSVLYRGRWRGRESTNDSWA